MHTQFLPRSKSAVVLWILFVVMLALLLTLSIWQWQRGAEKDALLARQVDRSDLPVIELTDVAELPADMADRPIRLRGQFLPEYRVALDNQMRQGRAGYEIHMAYMLEGHNEAVLVNLGWLPTDRDGGQLPPISFAQADRISGTAVMPSAFITVGQPELTRGLWRAGRIDPDYWSDSMGYSATTLGITAGARSSWLLSARLGANWAAVNEPRSSPCVCIPMVCIGAGLDCLLVVRKTQFVAI